MAKMIGPQDSETEFEPCFLFFGSCVGQNTLFQRYKAKHRSRSGVCTVTDVSVNTKRVPRCLYCSLEYCSSAINFTAVSFQVIGHMKTILVLVMGFIFFGKEGLNVQVVVGTVVGMIWYDNASSEPGGKELGATALSLLAGNTK
ncbi:hypothetical protein MLD38_039213 [Melastoma candidum]|uniref:Uncharacterized protein n=1 Tax=Melastoma candidum TaxID=119954 RepID=A0ACB9L1D7_9MYRT|nr:hypothetical protein MLD38_039213 [Melastoma candidum]